MSTHLVTARPNAARPHAARFASAEQSDRASRLGMWVFLASELLFFGAFFVLYAGLRAQHPAGFREGVHHADHLIGGINTFVLLAGSYFAASAVRAARAAQRTSAVIRLGLTAALALGFLALKSVEYAGHISEGMVPGAHSSFFGASPTPGLASYVTLYWITTLGHALHVLVGALVMSALAVSCARGVIDPGKAHRVELGALYWHFVDIIWLFVWPLFYLIHG